MRTLVASSLVLALAGCSAIVDQFTFAEEDAGVVADAGSTDGGRDGGTTADAGADDAGPGDAGHGDAGAPDGGDDAGVACPADCFWGCDSMGCNDPVEVSAGETHTCVRRERGDVYCWGDNEFGQLGDGTIDMRLSPTAVEGLVDATDISSGGDHSCAVRATGRIVCWGQNDFGQLGVGSASTLPTTEPAPVTGLMAQRSVSAGSFHTCAVGASNLTCWGFGAGGQLGLGSSTNEPSPRNVMLRNTSVVSAGLMHTCARVDDGHVECWGFNDEGQVGDDSTTPRDRPVDVASLSDIQVVDVGASSSCAMEAGGSVWCWGYNGTGNLGDNTTIRRLAPVGVRGLDDARQISVGTGHACAIRASGALVCWGDNTNGQLGDDTTFQRETFVTVSSSLPADVAQVSAGNRHTCAITSDGQLFCWGQNEYGQLGDGTMTERHVPTPIPAPE